MSSVSDKQATSKSTDTHTHTHNTINLKNESKHCLEHHIFCGPLHLTMYATKKQEEGGKTLSVYEEGDERTGEERPLGAFFKSRFKGRG